VDHALTEDRSLVITWLNRGTLHLVASEDYPALQALTAPPNLKGTMRRLAQEGVSPEAAERGVAVFRAHKEKAASAAPARRRPIRPNTNQHSLRHARAVSSWPPPSLATTTSSSPTSRARASSRSSS
jgi:hypothetical protein